MVSHLGLLSISSASSVPGASILEGLFDGYERDIKFLFLSNQAVFFINFAEDPASYGEVSPYLKSVFRAVRDELEIQVPRNTTRLPEVPTEKEIRLFYQAVWNCRNFADMVLIKTLFYTGVRVSELVAIRLDEVDVDRCQIRITQGKGSKDRYVPFPLSFRELLALHMERMGDKGASYLFESVRKKRYTDRGIRKMLARYATQAGITRSMSPHKWRHFLFTWLKKEGIDDALIQPYSGHATRQSLEVYSKLVI